MTEPSTRSHRLSPHERVVALALAALVLAVFAAANAHLVVVSLASQPECVAEQGGAAAKPAC
jgi:hypothetical protein